MVLYADLAASAEPSAKISGLLGKPIVGHAPGTAIARYFDGLIIYCTQAVAAKAVWWAHQDSNLEPKDSRDPAVSRGVDYLFTLGITRWGAGRSSLSLRTLEPSGSLCTFRWCTTGLAQDGRRRCGAVPLNSSRSHPPVTRWRHHCDESSALTVEL